MNDSDPPKPKLRWYQFQLRSLMVLFVVVCLGLGWLGSKIRRIVGERSAVPVIQGMGGSIHRGTVLSRLDGLPDFTTKLRDEMLYSTEGSLRRMLGADQVFVNLVKLDNTDVIDADLGTLDGLSYLECLTLNNTQITDAGLPHLYAFAYLQVVDLRNTQVTDEGVKTLQEALPNCKIHR